MIGHFVVLLSGFSGLLDIISGNPRHPRQLACLNFFDLVPLLQTAKYWTETFASEKKSSNDEKAYLELTGSMSCGFLTIEKLNFPKKS